MEKGKKGRGRITSSQGLHRAANKVAPKEPCFCLTEVNLNRDSKGWHRFRIVYVIRDDALAEFWQDMGPRENFTMEEFRIPGGFFKEDRRHIEIVHSVEELVDIADSFHDTPLVVEVERRDLLGDWYNDLELRQWLKRGKRVYAS